MNTESRSHRMHWSAVALVTAALSPAALASGLALAPNDPAPELRGRDLAGQRVRVDFSENKLTLVNFWATWCEPCLEEMPKLQELYDRHREAGLSIVGVSKQNLEPGKIALHVAGLGVDYPIVVGGREASRGWGGIGILPTSFLIDREGRVLRRYVGGSEGVFDAMVADIEAYLEGRPVGKPYVPPPREPVGGQAADGLATGSR